ncbi:uncharacterized protein [Clytia hemisphaerica]|uniref:uncharacterized protein isoform X2 n=1 Tax=Clytia hemisphaerica TaxID=252671 RepID=UPI0034D604D1
MEYAHLIALLLVFSCLLIHTEDADSDTSSSTVSVLPSQNSTNSTTFSTTFTASESSEVDNSVTFSSTNFGITSTYTDHIPPSSSDFQTSLTSTPRYQVTNTSSLLSSTKQIEPSTTLSSEVSLTVNVKASVSSFIKQVEQSLHFSGSTSGIFESSTLSTDLIPTSTETLSASPTFSTSNKLTTTNSQVETTATNSQVETSTTAFQASTTLLNTSRNTQPSSTTRPPGASSIDLNIAASSFYLTDSLKTSSDIIHVSTQEYFSTSSALATKSSVSTSSSFSNTSDISSKPSKTSSSSLQSTTEVLLSSSYSKDVEFTSIQPTPGHSPVPVSSISVTTQTYNITVQATYNGNCTALKSDDSFENKFFNEVEYELKNIFSPSNVLVHRDNYKCGSIIFNYTVQTQSKEKGFMMNLDRAENVNITIGDFHFTAKSSKIVKGFPTTSSPRKPDPEKLTVLYATVFSVVGFVFVVILVVIYIGCRKNVITKHKRAYELGRFSNTTTTAGVGMYGEESRKSKTPSESRSDKEDSLPTTWNKPKEESKGGVDTKPKNKDQNQNGFDNKGLETDEDK